MGSPLHTLFPAPELLALAYQASGLEPFPHVVIDGCFEPNLLRKVALAIRQMGNAPWRRDDHVSQQGKSWIDNIQAVPRPARELLWWFNSGTALSIWQQITGIPDLIADPSYLGGGIHRTSTGGSLGVHCDFNWHPTLKLHRRLNVLLFLNEAWRPDWNGNLELWRRDMSACSKRIAPIFNRMVLFGIDDTAFHGMPEPLRCPSTVQRLSLALYYYTIDRPESETSAPHWALWQNRPETKEN
ncbi:MAG: 2OG-Fe(II) oxygenase [Acidobacteria bacterium]|nr:2OG-Fe(II) oxygenase [Acidobacteriota bacterium]